MEQESIFAYPEDSVQLEKIINVHGKPLETQWSRFVLNAHFNETGIAMLAKFDKNTGEKIKASAQELPYQATAIPASAIRHWFPEHLKSQFILNKDGETYSLNYPIYSVKNMLKKPFNNGFAFFYKEYLFMGIAFKSPITFFVHS